MRNSNEYTHFEEVVLRRIMSLEKITSISEKIFVIKIT
jgi:hypothetical protein